MAIFITIFKDRKNSSDELYQTLNNFYLNQIERVDAIYKQFLLHDLSTGI